MNYWQQPMNLKNNLILMFRTSDDPFLVFCNLDGYPTPCQLRLEQRTDLANAWTLPPKVKTNLMLRQNGIHKRS